MRRVLLGVALLAAGAGGLLAFRAPVDTYTVELIGTGAEAGTQVDAECRDGQAIGRFAGEERADEECRLAEDGVKITRIVKLAVSGAVALAGLAVVVSGIRRWGRDVRSQLSYRRMLRAHDQ